jgi:hypothetical protein
MAKKFEAKSVPVGEALTTSVTLSSPTLNFRSFTKRDTSNVVTLQAVWRGYTVRRQVSFLKKQSKASSKYLSQAEVHETVSKKLSIPRHKQRREPYTYKSAGVYVGEWKGGFREGHGIMIWNDGSRYDGEWRYGRPCGWGRFTHNDGDIYEGNWRNYYLNPEETIRIQAASNRKDKYSDGYCKIYFSMALGKRAELIRGV